MLLQGSCKVTGDLGSGSYANVKSVTVSFEAAAKVPNSDEAREDLQHEAEVLSELLAHPSIISVFGWAPVEDISGVTNGLLLEKASCSLRDHLKCALLSPNNLICEATMWCRTSSPLFAMCSEFIFTSLPQGVCPEAADK